MNERIKELIKESGGIGHDDDGNELTPILVGGGLEKFAEVIIAECANIAMREDHDPAECIKKHFGVK